MLGLLHHAVIDAPRPGHLRVINSVQLGIAPEGLPEEELQAFISEAKAGTR